MAHAWENSLGMRFVPVPGTAVLFCVWETRVQDYQVFHEATGRAWNKPGFEQDPTHPAVNINWEDAKAFCDWLRAEVQAEMRAEMRAEMQAEMQAAAPENPAAPPR